jgi:L-serine deaminase
LPVRLNIQLAQKIIASDNKLFKIIKKINRQLATAFVQLMGREVVVAVTNGKLPFGPWEQTFYGEFDGRRRKRVLVKIIGE